MHLVSGMEDSQARMVLAGFMGEKYGIWKEAEGLSGKGKAWAKQNSRGQVSLWWTPFT